MDKILKNDYNYKKDYIIKINNLMTAYLAYSYSTGLSKEQRIKIDKKTKKSRKEFRRGFVTGITLALYLLLTSTAYAVETLPKTSGETGSGQPAPTPSTPSTPKPVPDGTLTGSYIGGFCAICLIKLQKGSDFCFGAAFALVLILPNLIDSIVIYSLRKLKLL